MNRCADILLVDDKADSLAVRLNRSRRMKGLCRFDPLELKWQPEIEAELSRELKRRRTEGKTYALVILGLRFGEEPGYDHSGYHLIRHLKRFYPKAPIIIHSMHDEMGELARAFRNGAVWFLRKGEIFDLPRHIKQLVKPRKWLPEWRTISLFKGVKFAFEESRKLDAFKAAFDAPRQYLTYKCMEPFPGQTIRIKPMGGGFSSSATFSAVKASVGKVLQVPVVIKIDSWEYTMMEYERYQRFIRPYIPNDSGRVEERARAIDADHSAIVYSFAGSQSENRVLRDAKSMLIDDLNHAKRCDMRKYHAALDQLFKEVLPRIHRVDPVLESDGRLALSSYPNPDFDEVPSDDFLGNWLKRIPLDEKSPYWFPELPQMVAQVKAIVAADVGHCRFKCPIGIVHGDLNFANMMVETYRKGCRSGGKIADAWLIDFSMTRRDLIAHDFGVMFTGALSLWFRPEGLTKAHLKVLMENFDALVRTAVFGGRTVLTSEVRRDPRIMFVLDILRRIRKAALAAGLSKDMYALTAVMNLLIAQRIQLQYEHNEEAAKGMRHAAQVCVEKLCGCSMKGE